jgi:hypothetical protein
MDIHPPGFNVDDNSGSDGMAVHPYSSSALLSFVFLQLYLLGRFFLFFLLLLFIGGRLEYFGFSENGN